MDTGITKFDHNIKEEIFLKNKGFSLIEVCIAIALIGIMVSIGGHSAKKYLANGKNTKAIVTLNVVRTASQLYYTVNGKPVYVDGEDSVTTIKKLKEYMDKKTFENVKDGKINIGGAKSDNKTYYGGYVELTFKNPDEEAEENDGIYLYLKGVGDKIYDLGGKKWSEY